MTSCRLCGHRHFEPIEHELPDAQRCVHCGAIYWPGQRTSPFTDDLLDYAAETEALRREERAELADHRAVDGDGVHRVMGGS